MSDKPALNPSCFQPPLVQKEHMQLLNNARWDTVDNIVYQRNEICDNGTYRRSSSDLTYYRFITDDLDITTPGYFIDRWKLVSGSAHFNASTGLTLNGTMEQILEYKPEGPVVSTFCYDDNGNMRLEDAPYDPETNTVQITLTGQKILGAKTEPGTIQTLGKKSGGIWTFSDPYYNADRETADCRRFYQRLELLIGTGSRFITPLLFVDYQFAIPMRIKPTIANYAQIIDKSSVSRFSDARRGGYVSDLTAYVSYHTRNSVHTFWILTGSWPTNDYITSDLELSADL